MYAYKKYGPSFLFHYKSSANRNWNILRVCIFTIDHQPASNLSLSKLAFGILDSIYLKKQEYRKELTEGKKNNYFIVVIVLFCIIF